MRLLRTGETCHPAYLLDQILTPASISSMEGLRKQGCLPPVLGAPMSIELKDRLRCGVRNS